MPLVFNQNLSSTLRLLLWDIQESPEALLRLVKLSPAQASRYAEFHLEKRQKEWLSQQVLKQIAGFDREIKLLKSGKPVVDEHCHISFSHCKNLSGFLWGVKPCGLDIQDINPKLARIASRFVNDLEYPQNLIPAHKDEFLAKLWSAKESVFKMYGEEIVFKTEMISSNFEATDNAMQIALLKKGFENEFYVRFKSHEEFFVGYVEM